MYENMKIILIGSFAGNNAGDMVILESLIWDFLQYLAGSSNKGKFILTELDIGEEVELIIPTLGTDNLEILKKFTLCESKLKIKAIPIKKNIISIIRFLASTIKYFLKADMIFTTAGVLFDHKIWNPLYNFVIAYTPLIYLSKIVNKQVRVVGYNVGITMRSKCFGKYMLKKCVMLHDKIYLRDKQDANVLQQLGYNGIIVESSDNVFGYGAPVKKEYENIRKKYI